MKTIGHPSNHVGSAHLTDEVIIELLRYSHPDREKIRKQQAVMDEFQVLMKTIVEYCPHSADRTSALQNLRLACLWACSAIALEKE